MTLLTRREPFREFSTMQDRVNRIDSELVENSGTSGML